MIPAENHIIVRVDLDQKTEQVIGESIILTGKRYSVNHREKNPVVAEVLQGFGVLEPGMWIVCNYCHFDWNSPYVLYDNVYSIPYDEELFAIIEEDGSLIPINGNLLVECITKDSPIDLPPELKKEYWDRGIVVKGVPRYQPGDFIFWLFAADYRIVYTWKGVEYWVIKIHESEIIGKFVP